MPLFHLDESVTTAIAEGLRLRGYDCTTTVEQDMIGASDEEQLRYATSANRVIITADQDFLQLTVTARDHAGIVFWSKRQHFGKLISFLDELSVTTPDDALSGQIHYF